MATEISDAPVETAPATQTPATAPAAADPSASSAVETASSSQPQETLADASAAFIAHFNGPAAPEGADAGKTEEQAQPATGKDDKQPADEAAAVPEAKTPEPEPVEVPDKLRVRLSDPEDIAIAAIQRAKGISFAEAAAIYGAATKSESIPGTDAAPAQPSAAQKLEADVAALANEVKTERDSDNYLTAEHQEKRDRLAEMRADLRILKFQESQTAVDQQRTEAVAEAEAANRHLAAVRKNYPTISDGSTPLGTTAAKVVAEWQADPSKAAILAAPDAAVFVANEATSRTAMDLVRDGKFATVDLALASLKATPPAPTASQAPAPLSSQQPAPQAPVQRRVTPASGSKGQITGGTPSTLGEVFASVETADQGNNALLQLYGGPTEGRRRGS